MNIKNIVRNNMIYLYRHLICQVICSKFRQFLNAVVFVSVNRSLTLCDLKAPPINDSINVDVLAQSYRVNKFNSNGICLRI